MRPTDTRAPAFPRSLALSAAVLFLLPGLATELRAQSDAGTVNASVTIQSDAITVTGLQDLDFGAHFATDGVVQNEVPAYWQIDVSTDPTNVDLAFTVLPTEMLSPGLFSIPLTYGPNSFGANCAGIVVTADPLSGIQNCDVTPGVGAAALGDVGAGLDPVEADLSAAGEAGVYTATIELTATVN